MMTPRSELQRAFSAHLKKWEAQPFVFGSADCIAFTTDWIDAQCGTQLTQRVSTEYRALSFGEVRMLAEPGKLRAAIINVLGVPDSGLEPKLGDVVLFDSYEGHETLGVAGEELVYGPSTGGLGALGQFGRVLAVWRLERIG